MKHFLLNDHEKAGDLSLVTPLENQVMMNQLNSEVFPLLNLQHQLHQAQQETQEEVKETDGAETKVGIVIVAAVAVVGNIS